MNKFLRFSLIILALTFSCKSYSQNYYETAFESLKDTKYYPQINNWINTGKFDSILFIADEVYNYYYKKNEKDRALYLFNLCIYFPSGYGKAAEAIPIMEDKLEFLRKNTDTLNVHFGTSIYILASANIRKFELKKAVPIFNNAINILEKSKQTPELHIAQAYKSAAFLNVYLYNNKEAYRLSKLGLNIFKNTKLINMSEGKKIQITYDIAYSYMTIATLMLQTKQNELAFEYYKKSYDTFKKLPSGKENMAVSSNNMANCCLLKGNYNDALKYAARADRIVASNNFAKKLKTTYISVLSNKGKAYMKTKKYSKADSVFRVLLDFMNKEFKPNEPVKSESYINIANNFYQQNILDSALVYYKNAEDIFEKNTKISEALAKIYAKKGNFKKAVYYSKKNIYQNTKNQNNNLLTTDNFTDNFKGFNATMLTAENLLKLYNKTGKTANLNESIKFSMLSNSLAIKHLNNTLIGANDENLSNNFHKLARIGIDANYKAYKLKKTDKYTNNILNLLTHATAFKLNSEVNQITNKEGNSSEQILLLQKIRHNENLLLALKQKPNAAIEKKISNKLFELRNKAFELSYKLQNSNQSFDSKNMFTDIKYQEIQDVLHNNESLIAYFNKDGQFFSILIGKNKIKLNSINADNEIDKAIKDYYRAIKTGSSKLKKISQKLYSYLILPFEKDIKNSKKIVIIPDGKLTQIPFEALYNKEAKKGYYLIEKYSISYNYSIFLWLKNRKKQRKKRALSFVGFAPVFSQEEATVNNLNPLSYNRDLQSNYSEIIDINKLKPLPYSEQEVIKINELFAKNNKDSKIYTHKNATEQNLKLNSNKYSIIHIATHGFSSKKDPKFSGLFFYKNPNSKDVTNDGFMYSGEIFTMKQMADLVVLSACKTGVGKLVEGEGMMALPRAFIFAGTPNLIVSLWKIHDQKTKDLMIDFYKILLSGKSYSKALRGAKLIQIKKGEQPIDWSGIILIGE